MRYRNSQGAAALSSASVDGAAFGTTFAHLFLMTFNNLVPDGLPQETKYVPRVFGFRVHPTSRQRISNGIAMGAATGGGNQVRRNVNVVTANTTTVTSITAEAANGVTLENVYAASTTAAAPAAVGADGKVIKKGKRSKAKSEDSGGSSKRRTKGDNETNSSKRQKHP